MRVLKTRLNHGTRQGNKYISRVLLAFARRGMLYETHPQGGNSWNMLQPLKHRGWNILEGSGTGNDRGGKI